MKKAIRLISVLVASVAVTGCGSLFSGKTAMSREAAMPQVATPEMHLAAGKRYMSEGLISLAVDEFRQAQRGANTMAEASNGLGVAYARVGREDLAERYFRMALALAPEDQRFAANLVRLYQTTTWAMRAPSAPATDRGVLPKSKSAEAMAMATPAGRIERVSNGEVRIHTVNSNYAAPAMAVVRTKATPNVVKASPATAATELNTVPEGLETQLAGTDQAAAQRVIFTR